jgi:heavy metal sensor kinase
VFFRSIRFRLTLWYFAILAVILVLFSGGIYFTQRRTLNENLNDSLRTRATLLQGLIDYDASGRPTLDLPANPRDPNLGESFVRMFSPSGDVLFDNSSAFGSVRVDASALQQATRDGEHVGTVGSGDGRARIVTVPVTQSGSLVGILQTGQSTADVSGTLHNLLLILVVGIPLALVLASLGGWWLSSRALGPIDHVTKMAQEITGHDLSRRLNLDLPDDEVGRLARTFDGMIGRLDAMFQRQRQFTADASHELRTPLTAIQGQIDVALTRPRDAAEYQRVLTAVNQQVDRMTRLVGGLLMLARSDAGAMPIGRESVAVDFLVESVAAQVEPLARAKRIDIAVEAGGPVVVMGDQDLLLQLLLNLADNAVKYTDEGSITIGWRTDDGSVELFVRDTGLGIPAEHLDRIFERFHRVDVARSRERGGAGLGLAICKWIAEAHGGQMYVASSAAGSTFSVKLPLA